MFLQRYAAAPPGLLYDGLNNGFYEFAYRLQLPAQELLIKPASDSREFTELRALLPPATLAQLLQAGGFRLQNRLFEVYTGTDELPLSYYQQGPYLCVFASGEFQPGRYKIYLEGVWQSDI